VRLRTNSDLKFFEGSMIFVGFRFCEVGDKGESEPAMLGNGRSGLDVGKCIGAMERLRFICGRAERLYGREPSIDEGPARGEETEGRDVRVAGIDESGEFVSEIEDIECEIEEVSSPIVSRRAGQ
jgi:hypothetical protein